MLFRSKKFVSFAQKLRVYRALKQVKLALLEYLHSTRSIQYLDADNMSKNSPFFLQGLLKKVDMASNIGRSVSRYLRYHPINEFEPFFCLLGEGLLASSFTGALVVQPISPQACPPPVGTSTLTGFGTASS